MGLNVIQPDGCLLQKEIIRVLSLQWEGFLLLIIKKVCGEKEWLREIDWEN